MSDFLLPSEDLKLLENPRKVLKPEDADSMYFICSDSHGNQLAVSIFRGPDACGSYLIHLVLASDNSEYSAFGNEFGMEEWRTRDMIFVLVEPMKLWKICFNGVLRSENVYEEQSEVHAQLNLLFHANSCPVVSTVSGTYSFIVDRNLRKEHTLETSYKGYEQWGVLQGQIHINGALNQELNLYCLKKRQWGSESALHLTGFLTNGTWFTLNAFERLNSGHIRTQRRHVVLKECDTRIPLNQDFSISISDSLCKYNMQISIIKRLKFFSIAEIILENLHSPSKAFLFHTREGQQIVPASEEYFVNSFPTCSTVFAVNLSDQLCRDSSLVGGKAASLAKLNVAFQKCIRNENVKIPCGICLTVHAQDLFVKSNVNLKNKLEELDNNFWLSNNDPKVCVESFSIIWNQSAVPEEIERIIKGYLNENKLYAVRSSGILEDTAETSMAGQNATYLNIPGKLEQICMAVKQCWASLYSFTSVQYRREHGLPLVTKMGVVIQEMVSSDIGGVLFTRDPISGDPQYIAVSYCSGSAEAVVSGTSRTETLRYNKKTMKLETEERLEEQKMSMFMKLAVISIKLEEIFYTFLDIEFAIYKDIIYFLQCRPVTTTFCWTDYEIAHELDSAFTEYDAVSFYNIGEVMPGTTCPLNITFLNPIMEDAFLFTDRSPSCYYHSRLLSTVQYRMAINLFNSLLLDVQEEIPLQQKILDIAVCGQVITTDQLYRMAQNRNGISNSSVRLKKFLNMSKVT